MFKGRPKGQELGEASGEEGRIYGTFNNSWPILGRGGETRFYGDSTRIQKNKLAGEFPELPLPLPCSKKLGVRKRSESGKEEIEKRLIRSR